MNIEIEHDKLVQYSIDFIDTAAPFNFVTHCLVHPAVGLEIKSSGLENMYVFNAIRRGNLRVNLTLPERAETAHLDMEHILEKCENVLDNVHLLKDAGNELVKVISDIREIAKYGVRRE